MVERATFSSLALWLICSGAMASELPTLIPLQGAPLAAELVAINATHAVFHDAARRQHLFALNGALNGIVRWGGLVDSDSGEQVLLADGSVLMGRVTAIERSSIVLENDSCGRMSLPRRCVVGIVWQPPAEQLARWQLRDRIAADNLEVDQLTLSNGDRVQGRLLDMTGDSLSYETTTGVIMVKTTAVSVWRTSGSLEPAGADPNQTSLVGLRDGSLLAATSIELAGNLRVQLRCGVPLTTLPEVRPAEERLVTFLQPANPAVTFLSDLQPLGYKHIPLLDYQWTWHADRNVLGGPLSAAGQLLAKGLGMHSTSRLAYAVEGDYDQFQAEAALDQSAGRQGSVVFRLFASEDGSAWKMVYKSDVVRGGMPPVPIRVGIKGAQQLALVVDFADRGDQLDRANWLDARLVRGKPLSESLR